MVYNISSSIQVQPISTIPIWGDIPLPEYRIRLNATLGFYFSKWVFDLRLSHKKRIKIAF